MCKICNHHRFRFILDNKTPIYLSSDNCLKLCYQINDWHFFLSFSPETKEFVESTGFGINRKFRNPKWWKDSRYEWKEMS